MIGASILGALATMVRISAITPMVKRAPRGAFAPRASVLQHRTTLHAANGKRECARRRRQIAAAQLTPANGLVRR